MGAFLLTAGLYVLALYIIGCCINWGICGNGFPIILGATLIGVTVATGGLTTGTGATVVVGTGICETGTWTGTGLGTGTCAGLTVDVCTGIGAVTVAWDIGTWRGVTVATGGLAITWGVETGGGKTRGWAGL